MNVATLLEVTDPGTAEHIGDPVSIATIDRMGLVITGSDLSADSQIIVEVSNDGVNWATYTGLWILAGAGTTTCALGCYSTFPWVRGHLFPIVGDPVTGHMIMTVWGFEAPQ